MNANTECDYDFSDPALPDFHAGDEDRAADLIERLQQLFVGHVSTRGQLSEATNILYRLEGLRINRASAAWGEVLRLKAIWKRRIQAQDSIDNWCYSHGYAAY
jgi:hypothetical protein